MRRSECRVEDLRFLLARREGGPVRFSLLTLWDQMWVLWSPTQIPVSLPLWAVYFSILAPRPGSSQLSAFLTGPSFPPLKSWEPYLPRAQQDASACFLFFCPHFTSPRTASEKALEISALLGQVSRAKGASSLPGNYPFCQNPAPKAKCDIPRLPGK